MNANLQIKTLCINKLELLYFRQNYLKLALYLSKRHLCKL